MNKLALVKGPLGRKYEGFNDMIVKKEEIDSALVEKCPSPNRKRGTSNEAIIQRMTVTVKWIWTMEQG